MLSRSAKWLVGVTLLVAWAPAAAWGHGVVFVAPLTGPTASPPTTSFGFGLAVMSLNFDLFTLRVQVTFDQLQGGVTSANLFGMTQAPGEGPAIAALAAPSLPGFPLGAASGTFDFTFDLAQAATYEPNFMAANGGNVDLASSALIAGMFAGKTYFNIGTSNYAAGEIASFVLTSLEADFNHNGRVDRNDLAVWRDAYPTGHLGNSAGDANGDVYTDGTDLLIWQRQLGRFATLAGPHSHAPAIPVPEPGAASGAVVALLALARQVRRRVRSTHAKIGNLPESRLQPRRGCGIMITTESLSVESGRTLLRFHAPAVKRHAWRRRVSNVPFPSPGGRAS